MSLIRPVDSGDKEKLSVVISDLDLHSLPEGVYLTLLAMIKNGWKRGGWRVSDSGRLRHPSCTLNLPNEARRKRACARLALTSSHLYHQL